LAFFFSLSSLNLSKIPMIPSRWGA
jgi:hypothetical protein